MIVQAVRPRVGTVLTAVWVAGLLNIVPSHASPYQGPEQVVAIVGATLIDGNGGPSVPNATIVVRGKRIVAVGPRTSVQVPPGARVIDGTGKYVTPGFIDTNIHHSIPGGRGWDDAYGRYPWDRQRDVVLQGVQLQLKYGVTTVRDSYGVLNPLKQVRDAIARGDEVGPRMYVAGNIVGWGGPYSITFSNIRESDLELLQEQVNDSITQGSGEEWMDMTPEEVRVAINKYLDMGPDFIKYGGTSHSSYPSPIIFSPEVQRVIVEETHKRGKVVETHSTTLEGLRLSIIAGLDVVQHPEIVGHREITDALVKLFVERKIVCSMLTNTYTGDEWTRHLEQRKKALAAQADSGRVRRVPKTSAELRRERQARGEDMELRRRNAEKLIKSGCIVTTGTDNLMGMPPEFRREKKRDYQEPGLGTITAIEGLCELGMTPSQAIVAATKNGAIASKALDQYGTLEVGKYADLVILTADPLSDIHNIRKLETVMVEGKVVDPKTLPTKPVYVEW